MFTQQQNKCNSNVRTMKTIFSGNKKQNKKKRIFVSIRDLLILWKAFVIWWLHSKAEYDNFDQQRNLIISILDRKNSHLRIWNALMWFILSIKKSCLYRALALVQQSLYFSYQHAVAFCSVVKHELWPTLATSWDSIWESKKRKINTKCVLKSL